MLDRPNILLLFGEQHRGDCLSSDGHPVLLTPNMDSIGGNGTRFTNAYSTCPVCVPARRSLISGQFPASHGAFGNCNAEWEIDETLGFQLRGNGYQTAWIGRSMHQTPVRKRFGFEEMVLLDHRCDDDYDEFLRRNMPEGGGGYWGSGVMHNDWTARAFHLPEELHTTNWTIYEAQRFLDRRDPTRPFCMVVSFVAAHPPLVPPAFYMERYLRTGMQTPADAFGLPPNPVIGDWAEPPENSVGGGVSARKVDLQGEALLSARAGYYGLINHLDDQIRRLMNGIQGGVPLGNTVIIYTADHGEMLGDHYFWAKSVPYQGSVRIPMLISVPNRYSFKKGQIIDKPVGLEDIMPTVLDIADVPIPDTVEGKSLVPLLEGEECPKKRTTSSYCEWREYIHIEHANLHHTLTDGKEKYIWFTNNGKEQFFDLSKDPDERYNLINEQSKAACISEWRQRMVRELKDRPEGFSDGKKLIAGRPYPVQGRGGS